MKRILISLAVVALVAPQIALASWWNPFTWKIFTKPAEVPIEEPKQIIEVEDQKAIITATSTVKVEQPKREVAESKKESIDSRASEIAKLKKEVEELKKKQSATQFEEKQRPLTSNVVVKKEVSEPVVKNFKEETLKSISMQIDSHKMLINWIDDEMILRLSEREMMLNGFILNTNSLIANETDPQIKYFYGLLIDEYNLDKTLIVDAYRGDIFPFIKKYINNEGLPTLNSQYVKFTTKSFVSEMEYNTTVQSLNSGWETVYGGTKKATVQYMNHTKAKDEMYQRIWSNLSKLSVAVSEFKKMQALQNSMNQLYSQKIKPLNCNFSSTFNGFNTVGNVNCY